MGKAEASAYELKEVRWRDHADGIETFRARVVRDRYAGETEAGASDEENLISDAIDGKRKTRHIVAFDGSGGLAASARLHPVLVGSPFAAPELARLPETAVGLAVSAFVVAPEHRHSDLPQSMFRQVYRRARSVGGDVVIAAIAPHLVMMYEALGFFRYGPGYYMRGAFRVPMMLLLQDVDYLIRVGSPLAVTGQRYLTPNRLGPEILESLADIVAETRPPRRSMLATPLITDDARKAVEGMLLDGLDLDEVTRIVGQSLTQEVPSGTTLIRADAEDDALFLLIDGVLGVVPVGSSQPVAYVQQGEVVGVGPLRRGARIREADVVALVECRVMALSVTQLARLMKVDPDAGARLLLNMAHAMAERLARTTRLLLGEKEEDATKASASEPGEKAA